MAQLAKARDCNGNCKLKECPLHPAERDLLRKVSPELDPKILLDTKKGLDAVVKFLDSLPQLLC